MSKRPQYSLQAILVIMAVLSGPLGIMASRNPDLDGLGGILLLPALFCCMGYLLRGWEGVVIGAIMAVVAFFVLAQFFFSVVH